MKNISFNTREISFTKNGIYIERFVKSEDGKNWGTIDICTFNPIKIVSFFKEPYVKKQELRCFYSPYSNTWVTPYKGQHTVRDISIFTENLKDIQLDDLIQIYPRMSMWVSDVTTVKNRPTALYRFYIESNDKKEVKDITKKLTDYFTSKGGEVR